MKRSICTFVIVLVGSVACLANIAPAKTPRQDGGSKKAIDTSLSIKLDRDAKEARLLIPKSQLKQLRAELEQMDDHSDNTAAVTHGISGTQTIMSGLFLSLALVFGGVWFVRSGKVSSRNGKALIILAIVAGIGSAATFVYANAGPPPEARTITGKMFSQSVHIYKFGYGHIKLETKTDGDGVELIVPDPKE
jgi:hypothetical protein